VPAKCVFITASLCMTSCPARYLIPLFSRPHKQMYYITAELQPCLQTGLPPLQVNPSNYRRPHIVLTILVLSAQTVHKFSRTDIILHWREFNMCNTCFKRQYLEILRMESTYIVFSSQSKRLLFP